MPIYTSSPPLSHFFLPRPSYTHLATPIQSSPLTDHHSSPPTLPQLIPLPIFHLSVPPHYLHHLPLPTSLSFLPTLPPSITNLQHTTPLPTTSHRLAFRDNIFFHSLFSLPLALLHQEIGPYKLFLLILPVLKEKGCRFLYMAKWRGSDFSTLKVVSFSKQKQKTAFR